MPVLTLKNVWPTALALLLLTIWSCATPPSQDPHSDTTDGAVFRHRWWNYYARGLSLAEQENYPGAISDIKTALAQRERDQRMARTYGMHFTDYFPHRELGILYWETGRLAEAEAQLQTSIAQTPTAKAFFYLDRVREERIRRRLRQDATVAPPPAIQIAAPPAGIQTRADPVIIDGTVSDPNYVSSVKVHGEAVFLEGARQRVDLHQRLQLDQGLHLVEIRARSLTGVSAQKTVAVRVDRRGPVVDVQALRKRVGDPNEHWVLRGRVIDPSGVANLMVNQAAVTISSANQAPFRLRLRPGFRPITVVATDQLGNATRSRFDLGDIAAGSQAPSSILLASGEPSILAQGLLARPSDRQGPVIRLQGWTASQTVYLDKVVIEGSVVDDRQLANITVNLRAVSETPLKGVLGLFSETVGLVEGENAIVIAATDAAGNRTVERIVINRKTPKARLLEARLSAAVLPFGQHGSIDTLGDAFQDLFAQQLTLRDRFKLVDRDLLEQILQEHKISRSALIESATALQTGRLAAADALVSGSIIPTRMGTEVVSRLVDTETAEVLTMVDAFIETETLPELKDAAERLALKLHREFQLVDGLIVERKGQFIVTDLGSEKVRAQRRILVVQERPIVHPVTHHPLGSDVEVLGRARLVQVQADFSKGKLHPDSDSVIGPSHGVITQ